MNRTLHLLQRAAHEWPRREHRVAFLSGLSDPLSSCLTARQLTFLSGLGLDKESIVGSNFPYVTRASVAARSRSLLSASLNNVGQYFSYRRSSVLRLIEKHWQALSSVTKQLDVICLSCGAELVARLHAIDRLGDNVSILALGPVASLPLPPASYCLAGTRDWVSKWFGPKPHQWLSGVDHLSYLQDPRVQEQARQWVGRKTSASVERGATCRKRWSEPKRSIDSVP